MRINTLTNQCMRTNTLAKRCKRANTMTKPCMKNKHADNMIFECEYLTAQAMTAPITTKEYNSNSGRFDKDLLPTS